jgi:hypothetical protein
MRKPLVQPPRTDALGRRIGFVRQPTGKSITLTDNELITMQWMHRHGDLSTPFIYRFNSLMGFTTSKNCRTTSYRYRDLYHETKTSHKGAYIDWPHQQIEGVNYPDSKYKVHRLSKKAIRALQDAGLYHENTPKSSSSWWHDFARSSYTASVDLACLAHSEDYRFIHHDTVINNVVAKTGRPPSFRIGDTTFNPDVLYGIHYLKTNAVRLFAVEIDMNTESIEFNNQKTKTIEVSQQQYQRYIKTGRYKKEFAFGGGFFLVTITTNPTHALNMMRIAPQEPFMLYNCVPNFVPPRKPPEPMPWFFTEPYDRPGHDPLYINQV